MELFVMNRFQSGQTAEGLSEKEAKILARLNARKSKHVSDDNTPQNAKGNLEPLPDDAEQSVTAIEEHKKKKLDETGNHSEFNSNEDQLQTTAKKRKKRKEDSLKPSADVNSPSIKNSENADGTYGDLNLDFMPSAFGEPAAKKKKPRKNKHDTDADVCEESTEVSCNGKLESKEESEMAEDTEAVEDADKIEAAEEEEPSGEGFTVLEEVKADKHQKTFRVLPNWLAKPSVISCDLSANKMPVKEMKGLDKFLLEALRRNKIQHLFPVQQQIIPWLLESRHQLHRPCDICVSAPTGSGKTLAFVLPTVQALMRHTVRRLRCLVVLPVHDLAVQVYRVYSSFCSGTKLQVALISGQTSFFEEQQLLTRQGLNGQYLSKADIVVCTPGRLVDHLQRTPGFSLQSLRYLIIDEADRIMDETHNDWLYHVEKAINSTQEPLVAQKLSRSSENYVQKLLFSATLSQDPEKLTRLGLFQPKLFTSVVSSGGLPDVSENSHHFVGKYTTPAELVEHYVQCSPTLKPLMVYHLMKKFQYRPALCFSDSRAATHRLYLLLKHMGDIKVAECSSEVSKAARDQLLKDFSNGKIDLMVCTDAVARGMDLGVVDCVISYDPPKFVKNYIHRVGRTARAGRPGTAITLLTGPEVSRFNKLITAAEKKNVTPLAVETADVEDYEERFRTALESLKAAVEEEKQVKINKSDRVRRKKRFLPEKGKKAVNGRRQQPRRKITKPSAKVRT